MKSNKSAFAGVVVGIFLMGFDVLAQIPSDANLQLQIGKQSATNFSGIVSNTRTDVQYEFQCQQTPTNWISLGFIYGSEMTNWTAFDFRTTNSIIKKRIRIRSWEDDGSGLPIWWQLKYFGNVGVDPYGNPAGDGWNNLQKFQNAMEPFRWYRPPESQGNLTLREGKDIQHNNAVLTWTSNNGPTPDFFIIERANRTLRQITNSWTPRPYMLNGRMVTNRPPNFRPPQGRPNSAPQDSFVTEPYEVIVRVPGKLNVREYRYTDTNVYTFPEPVYRIQAHYAEPPVFAKLHEITTEVVRKTILAVTSKQETNGYALNVLHPALHVRYLLLVRDQNNKQWRASGYFVSGTNGEPVHLHVDKKGMMSDGQSPIAMPDVKFLPDAVKPEFAAGYGEDSDGDYLPDIYEVLVMHTDPANDDTGDQGIIDGLKKMSSDGVSNLEKFYCRVDPLRPAQPPASIELIRPTGRDIWEAIMPATDLKCELQVEVRTNGAIWYQPIEQIPRMFGKIMNIQDVNSRKSCDVRNSWRFSDNFFDDHSNGGLPGGYGLIQPLVQKINMEMFNAFKAALETNPPLSPLELSNRVAKVTLSYRDGEIDKGVAMVETILLENYKPQDFYGKVIDQAGKPLMDVSITANLTLNDGSYGGFNFKKYSTVTDSNGLFEFAGIHGAGLGVTISKPGYENEWKNDVFQNPSGGQSSPTDRTIYRMWSTNIHEQLITGNKSFEILPDGKPHFINLADGTISEQEGGDLKVWIQYTNQPVRGQLYDWSAGIEVINGGLWEVPQAAMNSGFIDGFTIPMYVAPADGYVPSFQHGGQIKGGQSGEIGNRYFYLLLNNGKEYGKMGINLFAPYGRLHPGLIRLSYAINPSGSRILR